MCAAPNAWLLRTGFQNQHEKPNYVAAAHNNIINVFPPMHISLHKNARLFLLSLLNTTTTKSQTLRKDMNSG